MQRGPAMPQFYVVLAYRTDVPRWFHLVLVRPPGYVHASALAEALEYLAAVLVACGHRVTRAENVVEPGAHQIVACAHLLGATAAAALPIDAIVLNSEPLVETAGWQFASGVYRTLLARHHVWDYSHANVAHLGHDRVSVIPFWYRADLVRAHLPRPAGDRLLFYGSLSPHRRALLDALSARGVTVDVRFGSYGEERDREMRAALAVLNLDRIVGGGVFAPLRCFHPLINEVPVISEETTDPTADPFRAAATFLPSEGFADAVAALVADPAAFRAHGLAATARFRALDPVPAIAAAVDRYLRDP